MPTPRPGNHGDPKAFTRTAFTLVELLVVIGIIIILMGILLPVISRIRRATYAADTSNEISQLSNACNAYYATFHAYPGPLSNDYIEGVNAKNQVTLPLLVNHPMEYYVGSTTPPSYKAFTQAKFNITGSENLVLGLMGGLRLDTGAGKSDTTVIPPTPYINALAPSEVGLGPLNLNPALPGRTPAFFTNGTAYLMWTESTNGGQPFQTTTYQAANTGGAALLPTPFIDAANTQLSTGPIPEFVDRFPTPGPLPILYLRARTGAKGIISNGTVTDPTGAIASYQYDVREIAGYTMPNPQAGGILKSIGLGSSSNPNQHNLQNINAPGSANSTAFLKSTANPPVYYTIKDNVPYNAGPYFMNSSIPPTDTSSDNNCNYSGRPRAVDQFILISAGPDGVYGTADDITSVGDVSQ